MSKLFWLQGYRQLKLITTLNQETKSTGHLNACGTAAPIISPGQEHEINFGEDTVKMLPEDGVQFMQNDALFIISTQSCRSAFG